MTFVDGIRRRASALRKRIVLPEAGDSRVLAAAREITNARMADVVLVVDSRHDDVGAAIATGAETIDSATDGFAIEVAQRLLDSRRVKGMEEAEASRLARTPLYFADALVAAGRADASVAGAGCPTADVIRAALALVGPAPGISTVSSAFYMVTSAFRGGDGPEVLTFTDCAVVPFPNATQLADITLAAAADRRRIVGDEPVVALLSFSTHGSGVGRSVERVREAVAIVRERDPNLVVDGDLQGDAAIVAEVAGRKAPGSVVAGRANVLVFPTLDAGNIAYKLVQRLAGASAIGPILQGLNHPCCDLSRGAVVEDIINVAAIAALQSEHTDDGLPTRGTENRT
jgi:phosphate acetyltransferase